MPAKKSNYRKMIDGEVYTSVDLELFTLQARAARKVAAYNAIPSDQREVLRKALGDLLGEAPEIGIVVPPIYVEFGIHIRLGNMCFINTGATFLDSAPISLGERTTVGPNVQFITVTHPVKPEERMIETPGAPFLPFRPVNIARPITIGKDCWIGAGAIILPGITVGDGAVVGAGAVVTKSLPERVIAVGNPARIIGHVDDAESFSVDGLV